MNNIRENIAHNLHELRIRRGLTQFELAEKFHYSDKAISKWENGDTLPDVETLYELCQFYGVTLEFLISDHEKVEYSKQLNPNILWNRIIISILLCSIVWMVATIIFVWTLIKQNTDASWIAFVWSVPITALLLVVMNRIYFRNKLMYFVLYSVLVWTTLAAAFLQTLEYMVWPIFILGVPMQLSLVLWLNIKHLPKKTK